MSTRKAVDPAFADRPLCNAPTKSGGSCQNAAMRNSTRCRSHGGNTPAAIDAARVRALRQADPLMAKLHAIAFNDKMPPQVQLEAIKHALKVTGAFESKQTIQVDVGTNEPKSFESFVGDAIIDVEEEDWDESRLALPPARPDLDIEDADVVEDEQPLMNRHDRVAFHEVERARRSAPQQNGLTPDEEAIFAEQARRQGHNRTNKRREAFLRALDAGATHEQAEEAGRMAADGIRPDASRRRRFAKRQSSRD